MDPLGEALPREPSVPDEAPTVRATETADEPSRWLALLFRPLADRRWDLILRATGAVALLAIPIALYLPQRIPLVWFALVSLPACGPLSPIIPVAFEPLIFEVSKYEGPIWVTAVSVCIYLYTEYINWHIYRWVLERDRLKTLKNRRFVRWGVDVFSRGPFVTVVIFAGAPLPFWAARVLALLRGYPVTRFLIAMAIGRTPRLYFLAWVGSQLRVSSVILVSVVSLATVGTFLAARGRRSPAPLLAAPD